MTALHLVEDGPLDFEAAVVRLQPRLQRYAARRLGDLHEAEELVQEALLRACGQGLATEDALAAWCHVVTSRLVLDRLRTRGRTVAVPQVPEGDRRQRDTADIVVAKDEARTALDALDALPPRQAAILWAREVEGSSYAELGARFGMTDPAVRSLLMRARRALRHEYAARGGTLPHAGLTLLAPWAGMRGLAALHRAATRSTALAVAAVGITALGGLVLVPAPPATAAPGTAPPTQLVAEQQPPHDRAAAASAVAAPPARPTTVTPAAAELSPPAQRRTILAPVARTCPASTAAAGAGAGGSDCVPNHRSAYVYARVPVQAGPVDVHEVGVRTSDYDCSRFPDNPALACRTGAPR